MKNKLLIIAILAGLGVTGCKKGWLDVNKNPNQPPSATSNFVFSNAQNVSATNYVTQHETGSYFAGLWTQSNSYIMSATTFSYLYTNGDFNYWDPIYDNLYDYQYVIDNADKDGQTFLKGPALVMKAFWFQQLVDLYGNLPYTDALTGLKSLAPKFDDQKAVYEDLIKQLDTAIVQLKANSFPSAFLSSDIMFGGSSSKWIRFANTVKMRMLIRQSLISGRDSYITSEIAKIVSEGSGLLASGEDVGVNPGYLASAGKTNPYYDRWGYDPNGAVRSLGRFPRITKYLVDVLVASNDTLRLKRLAYAKGGESGSNPGVSVNAELVSNYVGIPFGTASGYTATVSSAIGPCQIVKGQFGKKMILMTAAEAQFLLAEAKYRYPSIGFSGTAQSYYEQGVKESLRLTGTSSSAANTILTEGKDNADYVASADKIKAIITQKWLATADFTGMEAWAEYRRTGYPNIPQSATATGTDRPVRLFYPSTEVGSNQANVAAQGTINKFTSRIFWDIN